jgi:hypothetical protein
LTGCAVRFAVAGITKCFKNALGVDPTALWRHTNACFTFNDLSEKAAVFCDFHENLVAIFMRPAQHGLNTTKCVSALDAERQIL